jgi:hypothetical protein
MQNVLDDTVNVEPETIISTLEVCYKCQFYLFKSLAQRWIIIFACNLFGRYFEVFLGLRALLKKSFSSEMLKLITVWVLSAGYAVRERCRTIGSGACPPPATVPSLLPV